MTRLKLLLAFALQQAYRFGCSEPWMNLRIERFRQQIQTDAKLLTVEQRQQLIAFMHWCCEIRPGGAWESTPKQSDILKLASWALE